MIGRVRHLERYGLATELEPGRWSLSDRAEKSERWRMTADARMVPLAGIEPALLAELDFESSASTSSATGAFGGDGRQKAWFPREAGGL